MSKKKVSIYFVPYISGESFLFTAFIIIFVPITILRFITQFLQMKIGPFFNPILEAYSSIILSPLVFFIDSKSLATGFGTKEMSEGEIQTFFQASFRGTSQTKHLYMDLIFVAIMAILILLYFYKKGMRKNFLSWIYRSVVLNFFITIPLWGYIIDKFNIVVTDSNLINAHYTEIYANIQGKVKIAFVILLIIVALVTIIGNFMILCIGKNYKERKQKWEYNKKEKEAERLGNM